MKLLYSWIYLYYSPTDLHYLWRHIGYMQINSLPAGGAVGVVEIEVSPVTLYTKQSSAHKRCFIRHYMQDEMKMTNNIFWRQSVSFRNGDIKTPALGFDFETCSAQPSVPPQPTIRIFVGGIYFNDILMGHFVISQIQENNFVVQTKFIVVFEKGFFKNKISPFGVDFVICRSFYAQIYTTHGLKFKKWKSIIGPH